MIERSIARRARLSTSVDGAPAPAASAPSPASSITGIGGGCGMWPVTSHRNPHRTLLIRGASVCADKQRHFRHPITPTSGGTIITIIIPPAAIRSVRVELEEHTVALNFDVLRPRPRVGARQLFSNLSLVVRLPVEPAGSAGGWAQAVVAWSTTPFQALTRHRASASGHHSPHPAKQTCMR